MISTTSFNDMQTVMDQLQKCIRTFDELQRVLQLLNHRILADACAVAADASRDVLEGVK